MFRKMLLFVALSSIWLVESSSAYAGNFSFSGSVSGEARLFYDAPAYGDPSNPLFSRLLSKVHSVAPGFILPFTGQDDREFWPSAALRLKMTYESDSGKDLLTLRPFGRYDAFDDRRTHFDLREASWSHTEDKWNLLLGASQVFWGVTESRHLVNVINQRDFVEGIGFDQEWLGQPMVNLNLFGEWGDLSFFYLPYFREMTFPSNNARLRGPLPIDTGATYYESDLEQWHPDFAVRYANNFGSTDLGLSFFHGTSREPEMKVKLTPVGLSAVPYYGIMAQAGLDVLHVQGDMIWKLEAITRWGQGDPFFATVAGFEYTFFDTRGSGIDVGLLGEYLYDGRGREAPATVYDNDVFIGMRVTFNDEKDTNILLGGTVDLDNQEMFFNLDASRRIAEN